MALSPREREILALLRSQPQLDAAGLARALGTSKGAVAVALSSLTQKGEIVGRGYLLREAPFAVVVGGAAWDIKARSTALARLATSNPGSVSQTLGGVGRNIAEGIARLGDQVHLIAAVGPDAAGRDLIAQTAASGVQLSRVVTSAHPTSSYLAALDADGELVIGVSDFAATDNLRVEDVVRSQDLLSNATVVVIDGNLPAPVVEWLLTVAAAASVPVVLEPVSVRKAQRLAPLLTSRRPVFVVTPNADELAALTGAEPDSELDLAAAAGVLHGRGVQHVWVSRGAAGSTLFSAGQAAGVDLAALTTEVVDVTGAGDALTAGLVHGLLQGASPVQAAELGQRAAALTVSSPYTVRPDLGAALAAQNQALEGAR